MTYRIQPAEASNLERLGLRHDPEAATFKPGDAGLVKFRNANAPELGIYGAALPYDREELADVIRQGIERPRALTAAETALADKNRAAYALDSLSLELWYRSDVKTYDWTQDDDDHNE